MISGAQNNQNSIIDDESKPEFFDDEPFLENSWENIEETNIITEKIGSKRIDLKSLSGFKPLAAEYESQIKILSDPNKYLYSSGTIGEFVELMNDRFEKLKRIIQKNPEVNSVMKIRNVNSLQNSCDVEIIGMVKDKRTTGEARHLKLTIEDPSGEIDILIANNERNTEFYKKMVYLTTDQVVFISGFLKVDNQRKSRIIFANDVIWPQVPVSHHPIIPECPVSIAFISDVHIGSKNFMPKLFDRFIQYLNCEIGNDKVIQEAGKIKYLVIGGDLVDGIGIYPNQDSELNITDIYGQFKESARLLSKIPDHIKIIFIPGNHEPVRNALPHPNVPKKYCQELLDMGVIMSGNPSTFELHGIKTLCFHGDSLIDLNQQIPGLNNDNPEKAMEEYLRCRHLAPIFGGKTELAPINKDWLVIEDIPHVFHTGHVHINGIGVYRNVLNINSGCFQSQTSFMKSLGINPTPGRPIIVNPLDGKLNVKTINLNQ